MLWQGGWTRGGRSIRQVAIPTYSNTRGQVEMKTYTRGGQDKRGTIAPAAILHVCRVHSLWLALSLLRSPYSHTYSTYDVRRTVLGTACHQPFHWAMIAPGPQASGTRLSCPSQVVQSAQHSGIRILSTVRALTPASPGAVPVLCLDCDADGAIVATPLVRMVLGHPGAILTRTLACDRATLENGKNCTEILTRDSRGE